MASSSAVQSDEAWKEIIATWAPFRPLLKSLIPMQKPVVATLTNDINDKFRQRQLRHSNHMEHKIIHERINDALSEPSFVESLAQNEPIGFKIVKIHNVPSINRKSRQIDEVLVFVQVEPTNGKEFSEDPLESIAEEQSGFKAVAHQIASTPWYQKIELRQLEDPICEPKRLFVKLCMGPAVPGFILSGLLFKALCHLCPHLQPLTFFWYSVMTENFTKDGRNKEMLPDTRWLTIEDTGQLVIFFLMHAQCVPNVIRTTTKLLPWNVQWKQVKAWEEKYVFNPEGRMKEKMKPFRDGPFYNKPLGSLFLSLLHFFTEICPLGTGTYNLDSGEFIRHGPSLEERRKGVLIDTILNPTSGYDDNADYRVVHINIMREMVQHLMRTCDSRRVGVDLMEIRRKEFARFDEIAMLTQKSAR